MRDPYAVLGVDRNADADTIKKAFKKLAKKFHPDVNKEKKAGERFKEVNEAYDILGDGDKRKNYDTWGDASTRPGFDAAHARAAAAGAGQRWRSSSGFGDFGDVRMDTGEGVDMEDLLGSLFGQNGARRRPQKGRDQHALLEIEFMLAVTGGETLLYVGRPDGAQEPLKVRIPPGVKDNGVLTLRGQGLPPPSGGACGDLFIKLKVKTHAFLRRDGNDLEMDVPITASEAIKGAPITVPTPYGPITVKVPPGSTTSRRLRVGGKGVASGEGTTGDLYLVLRPTLPQSADAEVVSAAETLDRFYGGDVRRDLKL